jgi:hypothetical protein
MKKINDVLTADNPERYFIRYQEPFTGRKRIVTLQIDNGTCSLVDSPDAYHVKSKCSVQYEGYIDEFCADYNAIDNGILLPDIAFLKWFNKYID